ncbi:MAG: peptidase M1 [Flavobacteriales bacterium]|nr:peptidase M1 [Flavobacteriales bacterium]
MRQRYLLFLLLFCYCISVKSQKYWQQSVDYKMTVDVDVKTFKYNGQQTLVYTNNSPDTISKVFYHLFYNAFKPGSEMATRILSGKDPNKRFKIDINNIPKDEEGMLNVSNVKQNGVGLKIEYSETILEVSLNSILMPGDKTTISLDFEGQIPKIIRRAGRDSKEGVALSVAQWFPKIAEYDYDGWNAEPYIGREFHGVWGDFDVTINIDKNYVVAASGYLQNPQNYGHGYGGKKSKSRKGKTSWRFKAPMVHDFTWAADPDFIHDIYPGPNGVALHFFYKNNPEIIDNWKKLQPKTAELMRFFNNTIGKYPYKEYNVVHGGDGGMEYAMLTLITGNRKFGSLVGVTAHELAHSWFQHVLATNEMKHEWMDEGFTSYISKLAVDKILEENNPFPLSGSYKSYLNLALSGHEQPQSTNANRYDYNMAYESTAYSKGAVFLAQLGYVIGQGNLSKTIKDYYDTHKFTHPTPNDFRRIAERVSGIQLKWYLTDWTQTTNQIDYGIKSVKETNKNTTITLERIGSMPMPLDVLINYNDGSYEIQYIPISLMRGEKKNPYNLPWSINKDWAWSRPEYTLLIEREKKDITAIVVDPTGYMADVNRNNNEYFKILEDAKNENK